MRPRRPSRGGGRHDHLPLRDARRRAGERGHGERARAAVHHGRAAAAAGRSRRAAAAPARGRSGAGAPGQRAPGRAPLRSGLEAAVAVSRAGAAGAGRHRLAGGRRQRSRRQPEPGLVTEPRVDLAQRSRAPARRPRWPPPRSRRQRRGGPELALLVGRRRRLRRSDGRLRAASPPAVRGAASAPTRFGRLRVSSRMPPIGRLASRANRRTMPTVVRSSKIASRMVSSSTVETCMLSFTPSWNSTENSLSPSSRASAAVELNAAGRQRRRSSRCRACAAAPASARGWPLRSISSAAAQLGVAEEPPQDGVDPRRVGFVDHDVV